MLTIERIETLLIIAAVVALLARRARLPYTVGLVVAGVALASVGVLKGFPLTKDLIIRSFLPPLIFEAAFFIRWKELKENLTLVVILASVGVLVAGSITATGMALVGGWPWPVALVFGTLIAATDPVSVIAMFKDLNVKGRLRLLVEAESLFNDGVAAVLFTIAVMYATGDSLSAGVAANTLLIEVGGGIASGAAVAIAVLFLAGRTTDHLVEMTFTAAAAFGAFLVADKFHGSGVLAVLVAGLLIGNLGHLGSITDVGREAVGAFWEFAAFVANSMVFLLIGVRESELGSLLIRQLPLIGLAVAFSLVGRALAVYGLNLFFAKTTSKVPMPYQHVLVWGGLKGALSLALAIGLPVSMPYRDEAITVAFGVVAFSVIAQGMTMPMLMRRLKLVQPQAESS